MTLQGYIILGLSALSLILYILYTRSARRKASIEYELRKAELTQDYEQLKKEMEDTGENLDIALDEYMAIRNALDPFFAEYGGTARIRTIRPARPNRSSEEV